MTNSKAIEFINLDGTKDILSNLIKNSAREMIACAVEAEVQDFLARHDGLLNTEGKQRIVRNGYLPEREITTGVGAIAVKMPRIRDRSDAEEKINFNSQIVPKHLRRSTSIEELLPLLYLKGISTNDFQEALSPLLGENAKNVSPGVVSKLKSTWELEYNSWRKRDLTGKNYIYIWADGIYLQARMAESKHCVLVMMGATQEGVKELIGLEIGYRESKSSWKELLLDIQFRGATIEPKLAVGDGALGFCGALNEVYPNTKHQRCWVHKTANILDKLPKNMHVIAKKEIQDIYMAENRAEAKKMLKKFVKKYSAKYPKATECLEKDEAILLTFYDFPAANWVHLRTTNPIESTFATVRHRTYKAKGAFSELTILTMVFKLCKGAEKRWKKLYGYLELPELAKGAIYIDGVKVAEAVNDQGKLNGKIRKAA
jgi:putative transposase